MRRFILCLLLLSLLRLLFAQEKPKPGAHLLCGTLRGVGFLVLTTAEGEKVVIRISCGKDV